MLRDRTLRLHYGSRMEAVCVLGTQISADVYGAAPAGAVSFSVKHTAGVQVEVVTDDQSQVAPANGGKQWPLDHRTILKLSMNKASTEANDDKVTVNYYGENGGPPIDQAGVFLTGIGISLDVDADRDGVVEKNNPRKGTWTWGPDGHGAILLVNCDKDNPFISGLDCDDEKIFSKEDLRDMSRMILRTEGPPRLPAGYEMVLYVPMSDSDKVGVFYVENPFFGQRYIHVLGRRKLYHVVKYTGGSAELEFFVEGLCFPDDTFPGLVSINISLLESLTEEIPRAPIFTDTVVFRVAPWIMTPNTLAPVNVFVCSVKDNYLFLKEVKSLVSKANCNLKVCYGYMNRGDRWMQVRWWLAQSGLDTASVSPSLELSLQTHSFAALLAGTSHLLLLAGLCLPGFNVGAPESSHLLSSQQCRCLLGITPLPKGRLPLYLSTGLVQSHDILVT
uniref:Uncharacterized protein n=1 Tax=Gopherus agassizii TaxID=38772 RepID=A0A452HEL2_9SAUR